MTTMQSRRRFVGPSPDCHPGGVPAPRRVAARTHTFEDTTRYRDDAYAAGVARNGGTRPSIVGSSISVRDERTRPVRSSTRTRRLGWGNWAPQAWSPQNSQVRLPSRGTARTFWRGSSVTPTRCLADSGRRSPKTISGCAGFRALSAAAVARPRETAPAGDALRQDAARTSPAAANTRRPDTAPPPEPGASARRSVPEAQGQVKPG